MAHHRPAADPHTRHQHAALDDRAVVDDDIGRQHRIAHRRRGHDAAGPDHRLLRGAPVDELCRREVLRLAANGPALVVQVEDRMHRHQIHVRVVERVERADVAPVSAVALGGAGYLVVVEVVDRGPPVGDKARNDVTAHVVIGIVVLGVGADRVDEHLRGEDVVAHRHESLVGVVGRAGRIRRLLDEFLDPARLVGVDAAERGCLDAWHPDTRDGGACAAFDVEMQHLLGIHPVHVIGTEHDDVVRILVVDQVHRLVDRVGAACVPARTEPLLRRDGCDVLPCQAGQPPVLRDVPVQGMRLVLGEHADSQIPGVDEIGQDKIDQAVRAAERNCRLCPVGGQRVEPLTFSACEDNAQHVRQFPHV